MVHLHSHFYHHFKIILRNPEYQVPNINLIIKEDTGADRRRYNAPSATEIAVLMPGDGTTVGHRDIILHKNDGGIKRINELNQAYDPLHYVLIFPFGQAGFSLNMPYNITDGKQTKRQFLTAREYYAYILMIRKEENQWLQRYGRLYQQYVVDMYAKIESQRLFYLRSNQKKIAY